jgi:citrate lyase subunit beta/citryl-CoA lyase
MRSLLFVPANRPNMIERAYSTPADVIVLDLEDSVPPAEKQTARGNIREAIDYLKGAGKTIHVRVNAQASGMLADDIAASMGPGLDGIALPKVEGGRDIRQFDIVLREKELHGGVRPGDVALIAHIESPLGILRCEQIIEASTRTTAIALGGYDYALALGVARSKDGRELGYARHVVATYCAAFGLQALDGPFADFRDAAGLAAEAQYARAIGFRGKYVIHPDQVEAVNRLFAPAAEEVEEARKIVAAYAEAVAAGHGSVEVDGKMVDTPVARRAEALISYAEEIAAKQGAK